MGDHALYLCPCTTRHRPGSLEVFGEQWVLLKGSAGILFHHPSLKLSNITHFSSVAVYHHLFSLSLWLPLSWESFKDLSRKCFGPSPLQGAQSHSRSLGDLEDQGCL